jgi:hypothetical protein
VIRSKGDDDAAFAVRRRARPARSA